MTDQSARRAGEIWTSIDDAELSHSFVGGLSLADLMLQHGRSRSAILTRLIMLGLIVYLPKSGWHRISSDPWVAYPAKEE